jgi:ADP-ribosyl-[dinitrogen reductase] hydrolase
VVPGGKIPNSTTSPSATVVRYSTKNYLNFKNQMNLFNKDKFEGCILGGAIGDAWGSSFENEILNNDDSTFYLGGKPIINREWKFTDDTILTLATCEVVKSEKCTPKLLGEKFVEYEKRNEIIGIGASTLKAIQDLKAGFHWTQCGRKGEYGAGNGSAMRIAPFAFYNHYEREHIRDFSRLTHNNDEAYVGALTVFLIIRKLIETAEKDFINIIDEVISELPDTLVKDKMLQLKSIQKGKTIKEIAQFGNNGYVVNSIPFAVYSALKIHEIGFENVIKEIIESGGDTDTNSSIAGQIMGTILGHKELPKELLSKLKETRNYKNIERIILI